ncbi:MAG: arsenosugar biosynthesis radical SAM protein ArsS [Proteobacteria bacterium]|nr:arsenosugar biosynthesis radical SAM protein ArsS [Pseudomonadota bacterium]
MVLRDLLSEHDLDWPVRDKLETLQVNMGRLCNMTCLHCHVNAGPHAKEVMTGDTANKIIQFLFKYHVKTLDITGGAPEMAPPFRGLVTVAKDLVDEIIVRCNLTILFEEGMESLPDFYKDHGVHLVCSLPCYTKENVDTQRGEGTFDKSIKALKILNEKGYGKGEGLKLDLVYNPGGAFLPGSQKSLETDYKSVLNENYGIVFDNLITITNMPINRFNGELKKGEGANPYLSLLASNFNPSALGKVMCRNLINVGWDGLLYDCDFNQALNMVIRDAEDRPLSISYLDVEALVGRKVKCADHCLGCVAGEGSSCSGALVS